MNARIKTDVRRNYSKIAPCFDPRGYILDNLFESSIITTAKLREINDAPEMEARAEKLLSHLFTISHPEAFVVFRESLIRDYPYLVSLIDGVPVSEGWKYL